MTDIIAEGNLFCLYTCETLFYRAMLYGELLTILPA